MKITELAVSNFRCFREATLNIAPITLVTGPNSAGKTSLLAPILAAAQTDGMPAMLSPNGRYVDMGDFLDVVHRRKEDATIRIGFTGFSRAGGPLRIASAFCYDPVARTPRLRDLSVKADYYDLSVQHDGNKYTLQYQVTPSKSPKLTTLRNDAGWIRVFEAMNTLFSTTIKTTGHTDADDIPFPLILSKDLPDAEPLSGEHSFDEPREFFRVLQQDKILMGFFVVPQLHSEISFFQDHFRHLGSFRLAPERTYYEISKADLTIGRYGQNYVEQLAQWESEESSRIDQVRKDLTSLGILSALNTRRLRGGRLELVGKPQKRSPSTNLSDLGFGTSQVLPVIVAINQLANGSLFTVSQPETHLHPEVQAKLADYFVGLAKDRKMRFVIETHSEYLINRLRLLVAEGTISEDDVSVVYIVNKGREATVAPIELRADGQIKGAPPDFFQTYMMDVMKLAMGADS